MTESNNITISKITTSISLFLSIFGSLKYLVFKSHGADNSNPFHIDNTPFTGNYFVIVLYWIVTFVLQTSYIATVFFPSGANSTTNGTVSPLTRPAASVVGYHFTVFNVLHFAWTGFFFKHHWIISEIILIVNFFNLLSSYFVHKTYQIKPLSQWSVVHLSTTALPLSWILYAIFWNGAVLFHVHGLVGRVLANILIWDFLLVPLFFLVVYNDYGVGLSSSVLMFGLGVGQLFTKVIALQWIFAFVISGVLFVSSVVGATTGSLTREGGRLDSEQAPLLSGN